MLFNSPEFIFAFLPAAVILHFTLARFGVAAAAIGTTAASLMFYAWWNPAFLPLPMLSIAFNFVLARQLLNAGARRAKVLVVAGIAANLLVLAYFKCASFLISVVSGYALSLPELPLALSFTTFVQIAFLCDVYRRRTPVELPAYALFVAFFPHLIAGPIVRWNELGPQIAEAERYRLDWGNVALGLTIFTFGLGKKLFLADPLAVHVAPVFDAAARADPVATLAAWGGALAYSAELYFDFSGYSDMAVGLGLLFNLRLPINFAAPFRATSLIDLWRRWHISLSRFLRDFVYVPLGGSHDGETRRSLNLLITMTLGGLWHGAAWTFILWGAFHGALLALNHAWRSLRHHGALLPGGGFFGWAATFLAFAVGMVLFRAPDLASAGRLLVAMIGFGGSTDAPLLPWDVWGIKHGYLPEQLLRDWFGATWSVRGSLWTIAALAVALAIPDTMEICDYREGEPNSDWRRTKSPLKWRPTSAWLVAVAVLFLFAFAKIGSVKVFLYYQF
jgi:alginate O-acetyltransferase complex protein AlgI